MIKRKYLSRLGRHVWGFAIRVADGSDKKRIQYYGFETRKEAEDTVAEIRRAERMSKFGLPPIINRPTLKELIDKQLPTIDNQNERVRAKRVLTDWLSLLPKGIKIDEITTPHIRSYVEKRQNDGLTASSIDRELNIIAARLNNVGEFFSELTQWRPPKIPRPKVIKSRRERIITDSEYRDLVGYLNRPPDNTDGKRSNDKLNAYKARVRVGAILRFAMNTGARPKEIFTLQWADIDNDGNRIRVHGTKTEKVTNSTRYIPMSDPVKEILDQQKEYKNQRAYVFTRGGNPNPKHYRILREAAEAVGIEYGNDKDQGFILYTARHTFTTRLLQAGVDLRTVGDITGHTDREMVLHYSHVTPESTERAIAAIETIEGRRLNIEAPIKPNDTSKLSNALALLITAIKIFDETRKSIEAIKACDIE